MIETRNETCCWTAERLIRYPLITDLDLSADGTQIVYAVREPLLSADESRFVNHLYRVSASGGRPLRLTYGKASHASPRWSPDGRHIAFLSDRQGGVMNLHVLCADGGESWALTEVEKGVLSFAWSPDGIRLAITMLAPDSEEKKKANKARNDPLCWGVDHDRVQLWVLPFVPGDAPPPQPCPLTGADRHVTGIDWTSDGQEIVFSYQDVPGDDHWRDRRLAIVSANADGGQPPVVRELGTIATMQSASPVFGQWAACARGIEPARWIFNNRVHLYPLDGGVAVPLATTPEGIPWILGWSADGQGLYVLEADRTGSAIRLLPTDGQAPRTLLRGHGYLSLARCGRNDTLAFVGQDLDRPNAIYLLEPGQERPRLVVQPQLVDWPCPHRGARSEIVHWQSDDGIEIEGILTLPPDYAAGRAYPTLVLVHGGPASVYSQTYDGATNLYPIASLAERGYVLLRANPRGSGGYGPAFRTLNVVDWGGGDYRDIMAGLDMLVAQGIADPERLGILGWSYGGYMTSWVITQTQRFKAASVGAGLPDLISFTGTTDITGFLPDYMGSEHWDNPEVYVRHSPIYHVSKVTTPTLIQHGEEDRRVPLGQGLELYSALKRRQIPVELIVYPRQGHGPNEPRLIMDIMERNLAWFDRWLGKSQ